MKVCLIFSKLCVVVCVTHLTSFIWHFSLDADCNIHNILTGYFYVHRNYMELYTHEDVKKAVGGIISTMLNRPQALSVVDHSFFWQRHYLF